MSSLVSLIEVSVVVPVYNTGIIFLETLNSIVKQTLAKELYEIVIVDDCSSDPETCALLNELGKSEFYNGVAITVLHHTENRWSAAARNTGVAQARGAYILCLDGDDLIHKDYLKKAMLILDAHPQAGWTYPYVQMFGSHFVEVLKRPNFSARKLFFDNYCGSTPVFRKEAWLQVGGERKYAINGTVKWYEDWDIWIRIMARGWYGVCCKEVMYFYRQQLSSNITRSYLENLLAVYLVYRLNWRKFLFVTRADRAQRKDYMKAKLPDYHLFSPARLLDKISSHFITKALGKKVSYFPSGLLFLSIFAPHYFVQRLQKGNQFPTFAEVIAGFSIKPVPLLSTDKQYGSASSQSKNTVLFAHPWWHFGGAENVLLHWIQAARDLGNTKIIDVVIDGAKINSDLETNFRRNVDEQYALNRLNSSPMASLQFCWNLIALERPKIIFIMYNAFFYILVPLIKKHFPEIQIVDLLHAEGTLKDAGGWFSGAVDYQKYLDRRIVISSYWQEVLTRKYKELPSKVVVAMNAVDLSRFDPLKYEKDELKMSLGIPSDVFVVGYIGRLDPEKNPMVMVALAKALASDKKIFVIVVGKGDLGDKLREKSSSLKNFKWYPYAEDPVPFYAVCDVIVCPSFAEGYPLVGIEAAAMNVPIIASNIAGFRSQMNFAKFGILYDSESVGEDANKIKEILYENMHVWSQIGGLGRAFVEKHHDLIKQKKEYTQILSGLLKDHAKI